MPKAPAVRAATWSRAATTLAGGAAGSPSIPSAPASATATTRSGPALPPMPACWSGWAQPTNRVRAVSTAAFCPAAGGSAPGNRSGREPPDRADRPGVNRLPDLPVMVSLAIDWPTAASLATAAGTLVLGIATFGAVRSSNRSARIAEAALQEQRRPLLAPSRIEDPKQKIMFLEEHWVSARGGHAAVEHIDGIVYLAISLRNVGSGIGVCQSWAARPGSGVSADHRTHAPLEHFHLQSRDLYVPAGDIGMWQGALRNSDDPVRAAVADAIDTGEPITVELLYSDLVGRQRTISQFGLVPAGDSRIASLTRHWYLDWEGVPGPRTSRSPPPKRWSATMKRRPRGGRPTDRAGPRRRPPPRRSHNRRHPSPDHRRTFAHHGPAEGGSPTNVALLGPPLLGSGLARARRSPRPAPVRCHR